MGNIVDVIADAGSATPEDVERLDGPVLPGMANLHSHAFQRAMAGLAETRGPGEDDFWSWRERMYRFVLRLTPDDAFAIARFLYLEALLNGYTAIAEFHYVHHRPDGAPYPQPAEMLLRHLQAAREVGIGVTLLPALYRWSNFGAQPLAPRQRRFDTAPDAVLRMVEAARRAAGDDADVRVGVAPHSLRAADPASIAALLAGADAIDASAPIHVHAAEQTKEVDDCLTATGQRPVEWLLSNFSVDARWCFIHATHMSARETLALARSGAVAGLCPTTEANLGDGVFAEKLVVDDSLQNPVYSAAGDFNGDGRLDLASTEDHRPVRYNILRGNRLDLVIRKREDGVWRRLVDLPPASQDERRREVRDLDRSLADDSGRISIRIDARRAWLGQIP